MSKSSIVILLLCANTVAFAQKRLIDFSTPAKWPTISSMNITDDGRFVGYSIDIPDSESVLTVESTKHDWKKEWKSITTNNFVDGGRSLIFLNAGDSMGICDLGTDRIKYIHSVKEYRLSANGEQQYLAYRVKDSAKGLVLLKIETGAEIQYTNIDSYLFGPNASVLLMTEAVPGDSTSRDNLIWLDLNLNRRVKICNLCKADGFTFDRQAKSVIFFSKEQNSGHEEICLRYYREGMDSSQIIVTPSSPGMTNMSILDDWIGINGRGDRIYFRIAHNQSEGGVRSSPIEEANVRIQGVNDEEMGLYLAEGPYVATVELQPGKLGVIRLQDETEKRAGYCMDMNNGDWFVTESNVIGDNSDYKWNISARPDIYLVSTRTKSRNLLAKRLLYRDMQFSPLSKYILWFDRTKKEWFSHTIASGKTRAITGNLGTPFYQENDYPDLPEPCHIAAWLKNDEAVLIYDRYDIWRFDLDGKTKPVNITHNVGASRKIRFRLAECYGHQVILNASDTLLLSVFDLSSKKDGFYTLNIGSGRLEKLLMTPNIYTYQGDDFSGGHSPGSILKAKNANLYVLPKMSAREYPNWCVTHDFHSFEQVTRLSPQIQFNWYTSELVHWKLPDGTLGEGILYKPENFDPKKKYPVIFYYYEKNAFDLNLFIHPALSEGRMNIPWFASNGYLVFVPDIYYKIGYPGKSAYNSVVSASLYLSSKPWVDGHRMGLQGHSYGGFETNYIISHSHLFVAAAPASAESNITTNYVENGITWYFERRQGRMGETLWQRPQLYIDNSALFTADKVTAAVMIMHTENDGVVPYSQGLQWYNALHRLGKKCWLLSYENASHLLLEHKDQLDYSIRLAQFFGYYLKDEPPSQWMTMGAVSELKSKNKGLDLDMSGRKP